MAAWHAQVRYESDGSVDALLLPLNFCHWGDKPPQSQHLRGGTVKPDVLPNKYQVPSAAHGLAVQRGTHIIIMMPRTI